MGNLEAMPTNKKGKMCNKLSPELEKLINDVNKKAIEIDEMIPGPLGTATLWERLVGRIKWEWYFLKEWK